MSLWPRGSAMSVRRTSSMRARKSSSRANIVSPLSGARPPVMIRVGSPSVWVSTVEIHRLNSIVNGLC